MNSISNPVALPSMGSRSPILHYYRSNLKLAYYLANAGLMAAIMGIFGYVKYNEWRLEEWRKTTGRDKGPMIVVIPYRDMAQPPSILPDDFRGNSGVARVPAIAVHGVPKPVPDDRALQLTSLDQADITGDNNPDINRDPNGDQVRIVVQDDIPDINAYVPYDIPPRAVVRKPAAYPEIARKVGMEGTTFVKMLLNIDGTVMRVAVVKSSGFPQLDTAAVACVAGWKFSPAIQNTRPVRVWLGTKIDFKLK